MPDTDGGGSSEWEQTLALLARREQRKWDSFSWVALRPLISSLNDRLNRYAPTLVTDLRREWLTRQDCGDRLIVDRTGCSSFIVLGDPGEQDASQYVVVPALREQAAGVDFMVICSDVIYPAGDVNDYVDGFYIPYGELPGLPILALPGNHDWYEGLTGFMWHFCGAEPLPPKAYRPARGTPLREWPSRLLWRRPARPQSRLHLARRRAARAPGGDWSPLQPGPYYAVETAEVLLVCIDTGIDGRIDRQQGEWLRRVSAHPKPKVLLTGKPLVANRVRQPCLITGGPVTDPADGSSPMFRSVADIVEHRPHRYVACIGGDNHNFQHYRIGHLEHVVSGGGGAYMMATHPIPVAVQGATGPQPDVPPAKRLFPGEAESLMHFARLLLPRVWRLVRALIAVLVGLTAGVAALTPSADGSPVRQAAGWAPWALAGCVGLRVIVVPAGWTHSRAYRAGVVGAALLTGVTIAYVTWWLDHDHLVRHAMAWVGLTACGGVLAWLLRLTGWWRPPSGGFHLVDRRETSVWLPVLAVGFAVFPIVVWVVLRDWWLTGAAAVTTVAAFAGWRARWQRRLPGPPRPRSAWRAWAPAVAYLVQTLDGVVVLDRLVVPDVPQVVLGIAAGLAAIAVVTGAAIVLLCALLPLGMARAGLVLPLIGAGLWAVSAGCGGDTPVRRTAIATVIVLFGPIAAVFLVDSLRRRLGRPYKYVAVAAAVGLYVLLLGIGAFDGWLPRTAATAGLVVAMGTTTIVTLHLVFLGAFSLIWDPDAHRLRRQFSQAEAAQVIRWRSGGSRPPSRQVRRRANIAFPGADQPHGPIQSAVSEIFDSDRPPFVKNFLVVTTAPGLLTITAHVVTGTGDAPAPYEIFVELPA